MNNIHVLANNSSDDATSGPEMFPRRESFDKMYAFVNQLMDQDTESAYMALSPTIRNNWSEVKFNADIEAISLEVVRDITVVERGMKPLVGSNYEGDGKIYPYMRAVVNNCINLQLWATKDAIIKINISKQLNNIVLDNASMNIINSNILQALERYSKINNIKIDKLLSDGTTNVVDKRTEAYYKVINNGEWRERYILKIININDPSLYGEVVLEANTKSSASNAQIPQIKFVGLGHKKRMISE